MAETEVSESGEPEGVSPRATPPRDRGDRRGFRAFTLALALGLAFSLGVSPALRGMHVGLEPWIDRSDRVASLVSQVAAILGSILTVRLLLGLRTKRPWPIAGLVGVLAVVPLIVLLSAMRGALSSTVLLLDAIIVGFMSALVATARMTVQPRSALLPALLALSLTGRITFFFDPRPALIPIVGWLSLSSSLLCCLLAIQGRRRAASALAWSAPLVDSDFLNRVFRGALDPIFLTHLGDVPFVAVLIWLFLPATIFVHSKDRSGRGLSAPLLVFSSLSPLTPLSLLAATVGLLGLLPAASNEADRTSGTNPTQS